MKHTTITLDSVSVAYRGTLYHYTLFRGALVLEDIQLTNMPDGVRLVLILLCRAKKLMIREHYQDLREPIWQCLERTGGLSRAGKEKFGAEEAVQEAAEIDLTARSLAAEALIEEPDKAREQDEACEPPDVSDARIVLVPVERIIPNPLNATIYDAEISPALLASVAECGVRVPVRLTEQYVLVDGHQRTGAAKEAEIGKIPAIIEDIPDKEHLSMLLELNRQRIKSTIEQLREYRIYLRMEKETAASRAGSRTDLGKNFAQGPKEYGKARDLAAVKVGMSGTSAALGLRVLEEIEMRENSGEGNVDVSKVKVALCKSIHGAAKLAKQLGWMESGVKNFRRKKLAVQDRGDVESGVDIQGKGELVDASDGHSQENCSAGGWLSDEIMAEIIASKKSENAKFLDSSIRLIRPLLYRGLGASGANATASRIRDLAEVLIRLASRWEILNRQQKGRMP